ncbi:MAG TPA: nidogen-like domain-containing protein [Verrucomicrobiae bacterium]|nr:nidogen-like domain-containing protein [Verrucomicrobiae bacterium]
MKYFLFFLLNVCLTAELTAQTNFIVNRPGVPLINPGINIPGLGPTVFVTNVVTATNSITIGQGVAQTNLIFTPASGPVFNPGFNNPGLLNTNLILVTNVVTTTNFVPVSTNQIVVVVAPCVFAFPSNFTDPGGILGGFATNTLFGSFDDTTAFASLPFVINYCGGLYSNIWINEDGNVTLDAAFSGHVAPSYVPSLTLSRVNHTIFAPFWADLDTTTNGVVTYGPGCAFANGFGRLAFSVTWSNVGYYKGHNDKANTFQMLLIQRPDLGAGAFDLQYRYGSIQWDTADSADGANGLCMVMGGVQNGYPARVGFASTNGCFFELPGSGTASALLDNGPNSLTTTNLNSTVNGVYIWHFVNGFQQ